MAIISLRKTVANLDETELRGAAQNALARCIETTGEYALDLDTREASSFRSNLEALAARVSGLKAPPAYDQLSADFRDELRSYRNRFQSEVDHLRNEVAMAVAAMQKMILGVEQSGGNHEEVLRREFATLEEVAQSGNFEALYHAIQRTAEIALKSCDEIRRSREVIIAQLQDEIRNLHRTVDQERHSAQTDPASGLWSRAKLDSRIRDLILLNESFSVFLAGVVDLEQSTHSDARLGPGSLRALAERVQNLAGKNGEIGMAGRWSEEIFAIIFKLPLASAPLSPSSMEHSLTTHYAVEIDGISYTIPLKVRVHAIEYSPDGDETAFYVQMGQAAFSVTAS